MFPYGESTEFFPGPITFRLAVHGPHFSRVIATLVNRGSRDADRHRATQDSLDDEAAKKRAKSGAKNVALDSCHSRFESLPVGIIRVSHLHDNLTNFVRLDVEYLLQQIQNKSVEIAE